jgi:hypothetical protein
MTKKGHKCNKCRGTEGIYVKICPDTGEIIEDYKDQYKRITKVLSDDRNFVKPDGSKQ